MNQKRGLTVRVLILILLAVIVVIMMYFVAQAGLIPSIEKIGAKADEVLILLHLKSDLSASCSSEPIIEYGQKAVYFFDDLELSDAEREQASFVSCLDGDCRVELASERYSLRDGILKKSYDGVSWFSVEDYLFGFSSNEIKRQWELYNHALDLLEEKVGKGKLEAAYTKVTTQSFELYGDAMWGDKKFVWQDGEWEMYTGGKLIGTTANDQEAIDKFYGLVTGANDDKVYWRISAPKIPGVSNLDDPDYHGEPISDLVGGNDELDSEAEKEKLLIEFRKKKAELLEKARLSDEQISNFNAAVDGELIEAGGKEYGLSFSIYDRMPLIELKSSDGKQGWLVYDNDVEIYGDMIVLDRSLTSLEDKTNFVKLRVYPLKLKFSSPFDEQSQNIPEKSGELVVYDSFGEDPVADPTELSEESNVAEDIEDLYSTEKLYKLPKGIFEEAYKINRVNEFIHIHLRCR